MGFNHGKLAAMSSGTRNGAGAPAPVNDFPQSTPRPELPSKAITGYTGDVFNFHCGMGLYGYFKDLYNNGKVGTIEEMLAVNAKCKSNNLFREWTEDGKRVCLAAWFKLHTRFVVVRLQDSKKSEYGKPQGYTHADLVPEKHYLLWLESKKAAVKS